MEPNYDPRRQRRVSDRDHGPSAWTIAAGVFLGMSVFYALYRVHVAMEQRAALEQFNRTMIELSRPDADPMGWRAAARKAESQRAAADAATRELGPGERCIGGQRFQRVNNGWQQVKQPC